MTIVLLGPKTRLGQQVVGRAAEGSVVAVARNAADAAAVAALPGFTHVSVVDVSSGELTARVAKGGGPIRLVITALGPVHPQTADGEPAVDTPADAEAVARDLDLVRQVLAANRPTQIILVSTVLALAPGKDRRYYGGWKNVVEGALQDLVDQKSAQSSVQGSVTLSVLYPGRLLPAKERKGRLRLHTSYTRVARIALGMPPERSESRVVGWDSQILLIVTSISLAVRSLRFRSGR